MVNLFKKQFRDRLEGKVSKDEVDVAELKYPSERAKLDEIDSVDAPLDSVVDVAPLSVCVDKVEEVVEEKVGEVPSSESTAPVELAPFEEKRSPEDFFDKAFGGSKPTLDGNIADLSDGSKNLSMKTRLRDVQAISVWEFVGKSARAEVLSDGSTLKVIADLYEDLAGFIKSNSCSEDGWRSEQLERIYTARRESEDMMPPLNKTEALLGKGMRR